MVMNASGSTTSTTMPPPAAAMAPTSRAASSSKAPVGPRTKATSCPPCRKSHLRCDGGFPCARCVSRGLKCEDPQNSSTPTAGEIGETIFGTVHRGNVVDLVKVEKEWAALASKQGQHQFSFTHAKLRTYLRAVELMSKVRSRSVGVNTVLDSLMASMLGLSLDDGKGSSNNRGEHAEGEPGTNTTSTTTSYCHGDAQGAMPPSLYQLFCAPFASACFVTIEGDERVYCNKAFEKHFLSTEECNRRLQVECQVTRDIMASVIHPEDMEWIDVMLDYCLFVSQDKSCEASQVLKLATVGSDGKEEMAMVRMRCYLGEEGGMPYMGREVAIQKIPLPAELLRHFCRRRTAATVMGASNQSFVGVASSFEKKTQSTRSKRQMAEGGGGGGGGGRTRGPPRVRPRLLKVAACPCPPPSSSSSSCSSSSSPMPSPSPTDPSCPSIYDDEGEDTVFWEMLWAEQAGEEAPTPTASINSDDADAAATAANGNGESAFFCAYPFWAEPLPFQQFFDEQHEQQQEGGSGDAGAPHHHHHDQQHQQHGGECPGEERDDEVRGLWHQLPLSVRSAHEIIQL